jgi:NDP-sugar pyrophosphorylase family protein
VTSAGDRRWAGLSATDLVILAGGAGTRLQAVLPPGLPKALAPIGDRPFLSYLVEHLYECGVRRLVFALGYGAAAIEKFLGQSRWPADLAIRSVCEDTPLGTGGALRNALPATTGRTLLAMNGDTFVDADLNALLGFHEQQRARVTVALAAVEDTNRYGSVETESSGTVMRFREKAGSAGPGRINGGVYAIDRTILESLPHGTPVSWEVDVLGKWAGPGLYAIEACRQFIDIGTPGALAEAALFFEQRARNQRA